MPETIAQSKWYMRNPTAVVVGARSELVLIPAKGKPFCMRSHAQLACKLVTLLREPRSISEIERELGGASAALASLLSLLEKRTIIMSDTPEALISALPARPKVVDPPCHNLAVGITGCVQAAMLIPTLVALQRLFAKQVDIILTDQAENFVKPETLSYFGFRVWNDMYRPNELTNVPHIHLARSADMVLIIPASAHVLHRIVSGACSDLLSLTVSATAAPVVIVPTMNPAMLQFGPIRRNVEQLRSYGFYVVEPGLGFEVCRGNDDDFRFCGIGFNETNIVRGLSAILESHGQMMRQRSSGNPCELHEPLENGVGT